MPLIQYRWHELLSWLHHSYTKLFEDEIIGEIQSAKEFRRNTRLTNTTSETLYSALKGLLTDERGYVGFFSGESTTLKLVNKHK